ncbi:amidase signature enzyme [Cadophora sp. DSE1049]|nr:amidase signature enzyme [Cadophora sp. DSE1049]
MVRCITPAWIESQINSYLVDDDVFRLEFLHGVILVPAGEEEIEVSESARRYLRTRGTNWIQVVPPRLAATACLCEGPCVIVNGHLYEAWRVYSDTHGTLLTALQPSSERPLQRLELPLDRDGFLQIAVASRLKSRNCSDQPLAGVRVMVKDNFHLQGLKVSLCNRAYYDTYPPSKKTAVCLQRLIDLGATIIGQAKLNSFGAWEEPTEYIDYQAPWHPRADGYQSPGESSTGSGAAIAAYDWLDIGIGSDTGGSIMRPGLWNGCFAVRPTFDAISVDGFVTCIRRAIDMPGFLCRDLSQSKAFAEKCAVINADANKPISKIIWPADFWDIMDTPHQELALAFAEDIERCLGVRRTNLSFRDEWSKSPPKEANGLSKDEYFKNVPSDLWYDGYYALDNFRDRYQKLSGKTPYISPVIQKSITKSSRDEALARLGVHREWFLSSIMNQASKNAIVIVPIENISPRYRDEPPKFSRDGHGTMCSYLSPSIGAPELIIPVGQIPYESKVTSRKEYLPFAVGIVGLPGTDLNIMDVMQQCLEKSGRPTQVRTGSVMFG